eukprot:COSAG05_NODE_6319_length_981_cov_1.713152_2_plen_83_part_00
MEEAVAQPPELDGPVARCGGQAAAVRAKRHAPDGVAVPGERGNSGAVAQPPNKCGGGGGKRRVRKEEEKAACMAGLGWEKIV